MTRKLQDYIKESAAWISAPAVGDDFAINIREECLVESHIVDLVEDGVVLAADDKMIQILESYGMLENDSRESVARAITHRILNQRLDLLSKYGPDKVSDAIDDVAAFVGSVEEIGSSDISGWVRQVEQTLSGGIDEQGVHVHHAKPGYYGGSERPDAEPEGRSLSMTQTGKLDQAFGVKHPWGGVKPATDRDLQDLEKGVAEASTDIARRFKVTYTLKNGETKQKIMVGRDQASVAKQFEFKYRHKPSSVKQMASTQEGVAEAAVEEGTGSNSRALRIAERIWAKYGSPKNEDRIRPDDLIDLVDAAAGGRTYFFSNQIEAVPGVKTIMASINHGKFYDRAKFDKGVAILLKAAPKLRFGESAEQGVAEGSEWETRHDEFVTVGDRATPEQINKIVSALDVAAKQVMGKRGFLNQIFGKQSNGDLARMAHGAETLAKHIQRNRNAKPGTDERKELGQHLVYAVSLLKRISGEQGVAEGSGELRRLQELAGMPMATMPPAAMPAVSEAGVKNWIDDLYYLFNETYAVPADLEDDEYLEAVEEFLRDEGVDPSKIEDIGELFIDRRDQEEDADHNYANQLDTEQYDDENTMEDAMDEAKYQGREVPLGKPMAGDVAKSKVYVKGPKGNVVKVNFGDKKMRIKKSNPKRRKSFRARHNCANPGPRWKARYWSCRAW